MAGSKRATSRQKTPRRAPTFTARVAAVSMGVPFYVICPGGLISAALGPGQTYTSSLHRERR